MHDESPLLNNLPIGLGSPGAIGRGRTGPGVGGLQGFGPGLGGKPGSNPPPDERPGWGSIAAFKDPPPPAGGQALGGAPASFPGNPQASPNTGRNPPTARRLLQFIPPLAMFNDASQWVNHLLFHRPMTFLMNPDSNPPLRGQYGMSPPPINVTNAAAGVMNLQLQLGNLTIQGEQLSLDASNYFGG